MKKTGKKIALKNRLIFGFGFMGIVFVILGLIALFSLKTLDESTKELSSRCIPSIDEVSGLRGAVAEYRAEELILALSVDDAEQKKHEANLKNMKADIQEMIDSYKTGLGGTRSAGDLERFAVFEENWKEYLDESGKLVLYVKGNDSQAANKLVQGSSSAAFKEMETALDSVIGFVNGMVDSASEKAASVYATTLQIIIIVMAAAIILCLALAFIITKSIALPLRLIAEAADKLSQGDTEVEAESRSNDEIGEAMDAFARMIENTRKQVQVAERIAQGDYTMDIEVRSQKDYLNMALSEMVKNNNELLTNIATASEQVAAGSRQVSDASISLSEGATEQASSIEQLTASMQQISAQTELNAHNADKANELAGRATFIARDGVNQMGGMLEAMEEINQSSANISKIIKVINDIAFQTNILALNAAVEAARAGQYGKGFAVVAEEVRSLAARSAKAADETTELIESSIKKSDHGTRIAENTAVALGEIADQIEKVAVLINDIDVASNEQAAGVGQINMGIMQVSQVVQANSATSEESAAASEELSSQAQLLKESVSRFKLKKAHSGYTEYRKDKKDPDVTGILNTTSARRSRKIILGDEEFGKY
ncbi:methyl-accepting chemotaxis protein [Parasporobacterium paucivorans]|uniref:Methyl-accepting chemotaxis protein n=1 Tax=Parasporobacterium paucivorans DSM 15970 TaxID=1122934 RepID=A0A1M6IAG9_9FIRM|nr:methyl-accepting chemotaxis protein [Parasporobacterium paucivorans]SHJ31444.1 methyl-accepting chemotaxis protein [Parasporobacterium paucivorans DSM 15970]